MKRLVCILLLFLPPLALSWGETGHRVVCQIAFEELDPAAKAEVERLISLDPGFVEFADSCLFADTPERIRVMDHFMNVPRSWKAISMDACPMADTCLLTAIRNDVAVLQDPVAGNAEKLLALKLLGHWVGDIHQPLHVSYQDDRGANNIAMKAGPPVSNLHGVWDYLIIAQTMGDDYRRIAADLRNEISAAERIAWKHDSTVEWANESYQITTSPKVGYCTRKQGACWYTEDNMMLSGDEPWREMALQKSYLKRQRATVARRLQQAGIRLAALLNRALTDDTAANP